MKRKFDIAFGLGSACCCSQALRAAGLQLASFPLDWVSHSDIETRTGLVCSGFDGWLPCDDVEIATDQSPMRGVVVRCRKTGLVYPHDFKSGTALADQWKCVDDKYRRRADRLTRLVDASRRALVVWIDTMLSPFASDDDCTQSMTMLRRRWPDVDFELLHFAYVKGRSFEDRIDVEADGLRIVSWDYRNWAESTWLADHNAIGRFLASEYSVTDYRTSAEKSEWRRKHRVACYAEYSAENAMEYFVNRCQYKLYRHLKKRLERKGIV